MRLHACIIILNSLSPDICALYIVASLLAKVGVVKNVPIPESSCKAAELQDDRCDLLLPSFYFPLTSFNIPPSYFSSTSLCHSTIHTGLKRVTVVKDPKLGIGCTIKNAVGHILVYRIVMDGPVAHTGALRPGV